MDFSNYEKAREKRIQAQNEELAEFYKAINEDVFDMSAHCFDEDGKELTHREFYERLRKGE